MVLSIRSLPTQVRIEELPWRALVVSSVRVGCLVVAQVLLSALVTSVDVSAPVCGGVGDQIIDSVEVGGGKHRCLASIYVLLGLGVLV